MTEKDILAIKKDASNTHTKGGVVRAAVRFLGAEERIAHVEGDEIPPGMEASVGGIISEVEAFKPVEEPGKTQAKTKTR